MEDGDLLLWRLRLPRNHSIALTTATVVSDVTFTEVVSPVASFNTVNTLTFDIAIFAIVT